MLADAELRASALSAGVRGLSCLPCLGTCVWCSCGALPAMAIRSDLSKTIRRIARFFYWFPKSLSSSRRRRTVKLLWKSAGKSAAMFRKTFFPAKKKLKGKSNLFSFSWLTFPGQHCLLFSIL